VCSVYGVQYDSKCHLHMSSCKKRRIIPIAYEAACISKSQVCMEEELDVFPARFLDWSLMVRDEEFLGEAKLSRNVITLDDETQVHIAEWIFNKFDTNNNKELDRIEQMRIRTLMLSVEKCIDPFLVSCDADNSRKISSKEWKLCLLPGSNASDDTYFDALYAKDYQ